MPFPRRIAVFNPTVSEKFLFPVEGGQRDHHSNYMHGAKYSNGGFTGERCLVHRAGPHAGRPVWFRLHDHEDRLEETIQAVEWLEVVPRAERINARFRLAALNHDDCYFSLFFGSEGDVGVYPKSNRAMVIINSRDMDPFAKPYLPIEVVKNGMNVMICTDPEIYRGPRTRFSSAKLNVNYLRSNIVKHRALKAGCHDALMLDECRHVSELSVSNLLLLMEDGLLTPAASSSPLNGITKRTVGTIAGEMFNLPLREGLVTISELKHALAIFATGTAIGIVKINRIVDEAGEVFFQTGADPEAIECVDRISQTYWRLLYGEESGFHPEWFTPIPAEILAQPEPLVRSL